MNNLADKIVAINSKHYLELPCLPGTTVYSAQIQFYHSKDDPSYEYLLHRYIVVSQCLYTVMDIVRLMEKNVIGTEYFFTREEAEIEATKLNEKTRRL